MGSHHDEAAYRAMRAAADHTAAEHGGADHAAAMGIVSILLIAIPVLLLVLYLAAVAGTPSKRRRWSPWRTGSFVVGCAMVIAALAPPLAPLAHQDLRAHMIQHLLLGMLGPIGIVFGAPVTLALRTLRATAARRLVSLLHSRFIRWISDPWIALGLNIGGMAALYATPLYARMLESPLLHFLVHFHFLAAGCFFSWAIAGIDPGPSKKSPAYRLVVLFFAIAIHATLSKAMYAYGWPHGTHHSLVEIEQAARIMYYGGDFAELILAVALFATWPFGAVSSSRGTPASPSRVPV